MRTITSAALLCLAMLSQEVAAATIHVSFPEGVTRGFLVVRDTRGAVMARGDVFQTVRGDVIHKRMTLHFDDGSVLDEKVTFKQNGAFALETYRLSEKGPTFEADTEIDLDATTGAYRVSKHDRKGDRPKVDSGKIELPPDVYNGMLMTVVKDLPDNAASSVHVVAFMSQPRVIEIEFSPLAAREKVNVGSLKTEAVHYVMKPKLGPLLRFFATISRRSPPDLHAWILRDEIPTFVAFQGIVGTSDNVWTIETISPTRND